MKLITEEIESIEILHEESDGKKNTFIKGIFLQTEMTNRNGRMYKYSTMKREVDKYTESFINRGRALGELGHPEGPTINLDRVSHKIVELVPEGTNFIGKAKLLDTPMGKIAQSLLDEVYNWESLLEVSVQSSAKVPPTLSVMTSCLQLLRIS